jgi:hypothetical protein
MKKCQICGKYSRKLTTPESLPRKMCPTCRLLYDIGKEHGRRMVRRTLEERVNQLFDMALPWHPDALPCWHCAIAKLDKLQCDPNKFRATETIPKGCPKVKKNETAKMGT